MSTDVIDFSEAMERKKRTGYSKKGCRECKRRKIKCDERKPECDRCSKLNKTCLYPGVGEKVLRVLRKRMRLGLDPGPMLLPVLSRGSGEILTGAPTAVDPSGGPYPYPLPRIVPRPAPQLLRAPHLGPHQGPGPDIHQPHYPTLIVSLLNDLVPVNTSPESLLLHAPPLPLPGAFDAMRALPNVATHGDVLMLDPVYHFFDEDDLKVLASDLNNMVSDIMYQQNYDTSKDQDADSATANMAANGRIMAANGTKTAENGHETLENGRKPSLNVPLPFQDVYRVHRAVPFEFVTVSSRHEKLYLEEFYDGFANIILPFNAYDTKTQAYFNPARDILLQCASKEPFLLAAILAQGARLAFLKNSLPEDEEAYCAYLNRCLKLLGPALKSNTKEHNSLTLNIEAVLLTVLLLASSNACTSKQTWRPHLRGAKDLLLKKPATQFRALAVMIFCKFWFVSIEVLAGLSSKLGGTLKTDAEIDQLMTCGDEHEKGVLRDLGILRENGFNIVGGYHHSCVVPIRDLIKLLNHTRAQGAGFVPENTMEYTRLLLEFYAQSQMVFCHRQCILSEEEYGSGPVSAGELLDATKVQGKRVVISWMDLLHQAYTYAAMTVLFTRYLQLPPSSPHVIDLTGRLCLLLAFLGKSLETPRLMKCAMFMIQWPMLVAGINCRSEENRFLVMKFFRLVAQIGLGSAAYSLRRINRVWRTMDGAAAKEESDDELDMVTY